MDLTTAIEQDNTEEAERILLQYVQSDPTNIHLLNMLALTELHPPFYDEVSAMKYLEQALTVCPQSIETMLILAYVQWSTRGETYKDLQYKMRKVECSDSRMLSFIQIMLSHNDDKNEVALLIRSIHYCSRNAYPYYRLGRITQDKGWLLLSHILYNMAKARVQEVLSEDINYDFTDSTIYFCEHIAMTSLSSVNYDILLHRIAETKKWFP